MARAALPVWFGDGAREQEKWDRRIVESEVLQEKRHSERDRHGNNGKATALHWCEYFRNLASRSTVACLCFDTIRFSWRRNSWNYDNAFTVMRCWFTLN